MFGYPDETLFLVFDIQHEHYMELLCLNQSAPNPKYYFRKNANFKLFQKGLNIFLQHLKFFQATVQLEICYQLVHDRAGGGHGSIPYLTSQTDLHACSQKVNAM